MTDREDHQLRRAVADGDLDWLQDAVEAGRDLSVHGPGLLRSAVAAELAESQAGGDETHVDRTVLLLAGGADPGQPDADGSSPLDLARARGHWLAALVMDRWGRAPSGQEGPVLPLTAEQSAQVYEAFEWDRFRMLYDLLRGELGVHQEAKGLSLLMQAQMKEADVRAQTGETHLDLTALLLAMGADPWRGAEGKPPLGGAHVAFVNGFTPGVLLFERWAQGYKQSSAV